MGYQRLRFPKSQPSLKAGSSIGSDGVLQLDHSKLWSPVLQGMQTVFSGCGLWAQTGCAPAHGTRHAVEPSHEEQEQFFLVGKLLTGAVRERLQRKARVKYTADWCFG